MSGSIGGYRINRSDVQPTLDKYVETVLKPYPGFRDCVITGSYNAGTKKDHGDIDLVVYIDSKDLKSLKKDFKKYLESLPDNVTVPFEIGKRKGDKAQLFGSIVTCGFPIVGTSHPVQIDNILVTTEKDATFQKSFLNLNAQKQALFQGLVRVVLQHSNPYSIFKHFDLELPEPVANQEYEFVLSTAGLSLRLVNLSSDFKELNRVEVWRSNDWGDVEWLLKDYDINADYEDILDTVSNKIKDDRSRRRIIGIMKSMIKVGPGEVGTPKGEAKEAGIRLAKEKLNVNEGLKTYLQEALVKKNQRLKKYDKLKPGDNLKDGDIVLVGYQHHSEFNQYRLGIYNSATNDIEYNGSYIPWDQLKNTFQYDVPTGPYIQYVLKIWRPKGKSFIDDPELVNVEDMNRNRDYSEVYEDEDLMKKFGLK